MPQDNAAEKSEAFGLSEPVLPMMVDFEDAVSEWVRIVDQDSQSETREFLDESAAEHSGE
ncbi:MAG: hypothetical protein MUF23_07805 [Pirellula sp.]|jgi:hypothetical protein|nr:hypothetical protein [Pirellula sp.]